MDHLKKNQNFTIPQESREIIILEYWSKGCDGCNKYSPVTLIKYSDGKMDLHCPPMYGQIEAIEEARKILLEFKYDIDEKFSGGSGIYYSVVEAWKAKRLI